MQRTAEKHSAEVSTDHEFIQAVRRASLGKVNAIEQISVRAPVELKPLFDAFRRAELQMVAECDKRLYGKKKPRRNKKR